MILPPPVREGQSNQRAGGVVISDEMLRNAFTTPSAPTLVAFGIILFDGAATPPSQASQGGEYVLLQHSSHTLLRP
ncbi:MAG: hypothetical protein DMG12_26375 [Acidobacteria bacterium]|nr:MAG: hypothetical protein DMG12_26375 [Acidobacteriota bacterium]